MAEPIVVRGTEVLTTDSRRGHRERIARVTLDSMGQFVALLDPDGTVLDVNQVALDAVGMALADVEGRPFWTTLWWQVSQPINDELRAMIARAASGELVRWDTEIYGRAGGRETIVIDASLMPVFDDDRRVVFLCAEGRDITERKAQERLIAEKSRLAEAHARSLREEQDEVELVRTLERIGGMIATELDIHRIVQAVTDEATKLVGAQFGAFFYNLLDERGESYTLYTLSGVPREAFATFPMPRNTAVFQPTFHGTAVVRSGDITKDPRYGHNAPHHGMPKGHLPVRSYLAVPVISRERDVLGGLFFGHETTDVFTEGHERLVLGIAGWAAVAMDNARLYDSQVRAREQLERALQAAQDARSDAEKANLAKSQFLAAMSHELRAPLNAIQGHVQLLEMGLRGPVTAAQAETLARVQRSQRVLQSLINDVLNFARLEAGRVEYEIQSVDVREVVTSVVQMIEPQLAAKRLAFTMEIPESLRVSADADKVRQIFLNLLSNSMKFTDEGGRVSIDAPRRAAQPDETVYLRVSDTGRGIPREKQAAIFDPFVQLQHNGPDVQQGIGLGLAISRDLARGMNGDLRVRSFEGLGSAFTLTLPRG